jgi:arginyl-tRNA synthetase
MPLHHTPLHLAAAEAVAAHAGVAATDLKVETPPRPELGDFAIGCFAIAKARGENPAKLAGEIAAKIQPGGYIASATATGPFVNLKVDRTKAYRWLIDAAMSASLIPNEIGKGSTICIDYSSPNISKHLAYHHIRGTVTGHALVHIFRALGHNVVGINFLGDWGTTHGMLIAAWNKWGPVEPLDIAGLNQLYVKFNSTMKEHPEQKLEDEGRAWFKRLEDGDPDARALWQKFKDVSWAEFEQVYKILGITFEEVRGESAYEPALAGVMKELTDKGLVTISEGAQVVQIPGEKTPLLLRKQDGSTLYATRDVAAAEYHWDTYHFTRKLYVVGREQALHFRQLYKALAMAGHTWAGTMDGEKFTPARLQHVAYGHIRLGGKKTATRLGNVVLMNHVFDIMQDEQRPRIAEKNPDKSEAEINEIARVVGIGAVVFANLASQREKDVDFDIEKVTSTEGDSGPYLQYVHARCASILRKAREFLMEQLATGSETSIRATAVLTQLDTSDFSKSDLSKLTHDSEWAIAKRVAELPDVVVRAADAAEPHLICHYLLQLAGDFSYWYTQGNGDKTLRVIVDDPEVMSARLALTAAVQATMSTGLGLLGIGAPDWM